MKNNIFKKGKIMSLAREIIKLRRNKVIAAQSKVVETTNDSRTIENGENKFVVTKSKGSRNTTLDHCNWLRYTVEDQNGKYDAITIDVHDPQIAAEGIGIDSSFAYFGEVRPFMGNAYFTGGDVDNINDIRYRLRGYEELSHFLDKYVIVTPEERQAYKEYEAAQIVKAKEAKKQMKEYTKMAKSRKRSYER